MIVSSSLPYYHQLHLRPAASTPLGRAMNPSANYHQDLIARLRTGDEDSLVQLLQDYEPEIRRAARFRLGPLLRPHLDSVDLVQSVCVVLLEGFRDKRFEVTGPEKLVALAAGIIRHKVAHTWRRCRRQHEAQAQLAARSAQDERSAHFDIEAGNPAADLQRRDSVQQVLDRLEPDERRLMELRLAGYSTAAAARELARMPTCCACV